MELSHIILTVLAFALLSAGCDSSGAGGGAGDDGIVFSDISATEEGSGSFTAESGYDNNPVTNVTWYDFSPDFESLSLGFRLCRTAD